MKKIALVTGGAKRLGKDISMYLASKGWQIAMHYNSSSEEAKETLKELSKLTKSVGIKQDLNDLDKIPNIIESAKLKLGEPSLLINNAGIFERDNQELSAESLQRHMNINCFAPILLTQEFAKLPGKKKVINIGDASLAHTYKNFLPYTISKIALQESEKSLNIRFSPDCEVHTINPGMVSSPDEPKEKKIFQDIIARAPCRSHTIENLLKSISEFINQ